MEEGFGTDRRVDQSKLGARQSSDPGENTAKMAVVRPDQLEAEGYGGITDREVAFG